jgi:peroxiredoxin/lysophospholipase L1-like esterase
MRRSEIHVLFFGDSHTVGVGDPSGLGWVGRIVAASYADGIPLVPYNLGVRGETSEDVVRRWRDEADVRASELETKVVFAVGANDTTDEAGTLRLKGAESTSALAALLRQAEAAGLPAMVVGPAPVGDRGQMARIIALSSRFGEVCEQMDVPFVNVATRLQQSENWMQEIRASDEAHPGEAGYEELARIVLDSGWLSWVGDATSRPRPDLHVLPDDLPIPEDDGAGERLLKATIDPVVLPTTAGGVLDLAEASAGDGYLVVYVYPQTGVPGQPLPPGWDRIPGARGCTPQSCAFRASAAELTALGAEVFGLSAQPLDEQREFAEREHLPYPLLNDSEFRLARDLELPTFEADGTRYYRRLTFIARGGRIVKVFYPVFPPQDNAGDVVRWLRAEGA